jgi:hypothetical protein
MTTSETTADHRALLSLIPLAAWTLAWVASLAVARFVPDLLGEYQPFAAWIAIGLNLVVGIVWIFAHARYLRRLDDLQRKILMDALAMGLGAGLVGAMAASVANVAGLISFGADAATFAVVASVVYIIAVIVGNVRYR